MLKGLIEGVDNKICVGPRYFGENDLHKGVAKKIESE
jgi:hypothetical protein